MNISPEKIGQTMVDERALVMTDREIYLCGEKVLLSAFTYEGNWHMPVSISSVLYVELYDQDNRVISRTKLLMKKGKGTGSMDIPRNVTTSVYYLRAYTNYMKNFGLQQFFIKKLRVVNPFLNSELINHNIIDIQDDTISEKTSEKDPFLKFCISLKPYKKIYKNREEVRIVVIASDSSGLPVKTDLVLLAVLAENDSLKNNFSVNSGQSHANIKTDHYPLRFLPETYGDIISGKLIYTDNKPAPGIEILQSFTGLAGCIESSKTDSKGNFYFLTSNEKNRGDLIFKIRNQDKQTILIPDNEFFEVFPPPDKEKFSLSSYDAELVAKQFINIQVEDAFSENEKIKLNSSEPEQVPFYGKEYVEYKFSDYTKLPNMKEFIFEVIVGVITSKENRKDIISVLDATTNNIIGNNPLIMIDGVPVTDPSLVLGLNPEKVRSVRVVRYRYYYKRQIFDGIMDILTYDGDAGSLIFPDDTFRYDFIHAGKEDSVITPVFRQSNEGRFPVYRNMLYWNPVVNTNVEGKAEVSFISPDNSGKFAIECFGFTRNGMTGEGRCSIIVGGR